MSIDMGTEKMTMKFEKRKNDKKNVIPFHLY